MSLHLAEIAKIVEPGAHAVLLVDQAGWHLSMRLVVPSNITIIALPPKCPELNPVEWPAPGSADTELGVLMEPEVSHGETEVYTRVQA